MKLTVASTHILRKLDTTLYSGSPATIKTQHGDIIIRKAHTPGYIAMLDDGTELSDVYAFGATPAIAFLNVAEVLKRKRAAANTATVVPFAAKAA